MSQKKLASFIKTLVRRIIYYRENRKVLRLLKNSVNQKRLIDFLTPNHGNIGDQAIAMCEIRFLKEHFSGHQIIEIPTVCWDSAKKKIIPPLQPEECILVHGGGFLGTLWMGSGGEPGFREILQVFSTNRIIVFPQSVFFSDDKFGRMQMAISREIYQRHSNLSICVREENSYKCIGKNRLLKDLKQCILMPDIVTYFKKDFSKYTRNNEVLLCLRNDKEKILARDMEKQIEDTLLNMGISFSHTDTVVPYKMFADRREEEVLKKMREFAQSRMVITDRLHGMILAAVTATPCLFIDNCSKKVSGSYEWLKNLEYIRPFENIQNMQVFIRETADKTIYHYDNTYLQPYYEKLADVIKE